MILYRPHRTSILIFFAFLIVGIGPSILSAHVLVSDGRIGASMHVDPDDDPVAGQPTGFHFWFKDTSNALSTQNCTGFFSVFEGTNQLTSQPLFFGNTSSDLVSSHQFNFPRTGIYSVRVWGTPNGTSEKAFQPFVLDFSLRVSREAVAQTVEATSPESNWFVEHLAHISVGAGLLALALVWTFSGTTRRNKARK